MLDKEIELQNEQLEELELLKEQVANLIKEKNEIKKLYFSGVSSFDSTNDFGCFLGNPTNVD